MLLLLLLLLFSYSFSLKRDFQYVHTGTEAEVCGANEKNQLRGGTWRPDGGPAFIPISNVTSFNLQPANHIAYQSNDEDGCVKNNFST